MTETPLVSVIMGSASDWESVAPACEMLDTFGVPYEKAVISAHRTPGDMIEFAAKAESRGLMVIIAAAGPEVRQRIRAWREKRAAAVREQKLP